MLSIFGVLRKKSVSLINNNINNSLNNFNKLLLPSNNILTNSGLLVNQLRFGSRGGSRGDTYQPNTLKRKRRLGFLARMKSRTGRQIVKRRFEKNRWFLTH